MDSGGPKEPCVRGGEQEPGGSFGEDTVENVVACARYVRLITIHLQCRSTCLPVSRYEYSSLKKSRPAKIYRYKVSVGRNFTGINSLGVNFYCKNMLAGKRDFCSVGETFSWH